MPAAPLLAALLLAAARAASPAPAPLAHPENARELGGFLLNQYADAVTTKMGAPSKIEDGDGAKVWIYNLGPEANPTATFMVFTVVGDKESGARVTAIQLSGKPKAGLNGLPDAALGTPRKDVEAKYGKPDKAEAMKDIPGDFAQYDGRDYSFEFLPTGELSSMKIFQNDGLYPKKDASKPDLKAFQNAVAARDRDAILDLVCADFEIYTKDDDTVSFKRGAREDILDEASLVSRYLFGGTGSVRDVLTEALAAVPAVDKDEWDDGPHPVSVFPAGGKIAQIAWNYENGKWRVWEIDLNPNEARPSRR